ncbi:E3 ubiquitin-protein ligase DIS1 [Nasonia vitripennis]|uniref:RING-type domain-containing protein n=1 Tax=Nasonia vitripennis TaxID=7425 RepID=A0A7M7QMM7_NASVI|nr:E3 ubiquitin-protein ligase DIS1 [Nasonia vitripennis]XP_032451977.1 E3 ubiquitin-protein ligase DIS1 [Nasonia vitripennis]
MTIFFKKFYAEVLKEILECPVCYELPKGIIAMCNEGHHICSNCMSLLKEKCPTCQRSYGSCRNYVAECFAVNLKISKALY